MDISKDVRSLLRTVAKDFSEAEGVVVGHLHFLAAMNHITGSLRQEFDRIVTGSLFGGEPKKTASKPDPAPVETVVESDPAPATSEQPVEPGPAPEPGPVVETVPVAEAPAEPALAMPAPAETPGEPVAEATPAPEQPA